MLYTILMVLLAIWLIGFLTHIGGGLIHLILLVCGVIFVIQMMTGRRQV